MHIWIRYNSEQVMTNTRYDKYDRSDIVLHSGRNMDTSCQLCMRNEDDFTVNDVVVNGFIPEGVSFDYNFCDTITYNDAVPYPDIISASREKKVLSHTTCIIILSFHVDKNAEVGKFLFPVVVKTSTGDFSAEVSVNIHKATIPEPAESDIGHEYFFTARAYFPIDGTVAKSHATILRYSDQWEDLMINYAKAMKFLRVNSLWVPVVEFLADAGSKRVSKYKWEFDFSIVDRVIDIFLQNGSFKFITITAAIAAVDGNNIQGINEDGNLCRFDIPGEDGQLWAEAYYSAIYNHFKERDLLHMLRMHLQDEPHKSVHWKWARDICRDVMPDVICGEPIDTHNISKELQSYVDWYIPRIEVYQQDPVFYHDQVKDGCELWVYSCCFPEEHWWLNKFVDQPHVYSRLIKYACFSQNITGFLHWGFNSYKVDMYGLHTAARFKGDGHIIYPDDINNNVLMSVRGLETKAGLQDWELLIMLKKINPKAARDISSSVAKSFSDFSHDAKAPERARETILGLLD